MKFKIRYYMSLWLLYRPESQTIIEIGKYVTIPTSSSFSSLGSPQTFRPLRSTGLERKGRGELGCRLKSQTFDMTMPYIGC